MLPGPDTNDISLQRTEPLPRSYYYRKCHSTIKKTNLLVLKLAVQSEMLSTCSSYWLTADTPPIPFPLNAMCLPQSDSDSPSQTFNPYSIRHRHRQITQMKRHNASCFASIVLGEVKGLSPVIQFDHLERSDHSWHGFSLPLDTSELILDLAPRLVT